MRLEELEFAKFGRAVEALEFLGDASLSSRRGPLSISHTEFMRDSRDPWSKASRVRMGTTLLLPSAGQPGTLEEAVCQRIGV